jgi:hypothetical protein
MRKGCAAAATSSRGHYHGIFPGRLARILGVADDPQRRGIEHGAVIQVRDLGTVEGREAAVVQN